jgi:hypothetical protein
VTRLLIGFAIGWIWGYMGTREICRCRTCGPTWWARHLFLCFFFWPIHWWERVKQQQAKQDTGLKG